MTVHETIIAALAEDIGNGDHSSLACIDPTIQGQMRLLAKADGIVAGIDVAREVLHCVDPSITMEQFKNDGDEIHKGDVVFIIRGSSQKMLTAERTLLNFMQRMSGIATTARTYADVVKGTKTRILDTRKTTPNMRVFEKYAVQLGGCTNHRFGLFDMVMLKDNHIDFAGGIPQAIGRAKDYLKAKGKNLKIEVEARSFDEIRQIMEIGGIDRIMIDNFSIPDTKKAVEMIGGKYETEASGGITDANLRDYAATGVDFISVGALTHQIRSLDLSLKAIK